MSTGVSGVPVSWLVVGSVVWNEKLALSRVRSDTPQARAVVAFGLTIVANTVAVVFIATDRLEGRTAAATGGDRAEQGSSWVARSNTPLPKVPACRQTPDGLTPSARTSSLVRLGLKAVQVAPPSELMKTPPPDVAV